MSTGIHSFCSLTAFELLSVWERGIGSTQLERALLLIAAAYPGETSPEQLSIGERDDRLLMLRESMFGPAVSCIAACPACRERLDAEFTIADLLKSARPEVNKIFEVSNEGLKLKIRLPNSADLMSLIPEDSILLNRSRLFRRCVVDARDPDRPMAMEDVSDSTIEAVGKIMSESDPQADIQVHLQCACCDHPWDICFDTLAYFWKEIESWAKRILADVHLIASEYGWDEREILSLSPLRRQCYLDLIAADRGVSIE